jgi:CHAT domain-containing protein/Tfp pilus assembly protein PilF
MTRVDHRWQDCLSIQGIGAAVVAMVVSVTLFTASCCQKPVPLSVDEAIDYYEHRGHIAYTEGRYVEAKAAWQQGLDAAQKGGRLTAVVRFLVSLSQASEGMGRYGEAIDRASAALKLLGESDDNGDPALRCLALIQKGLAYRRTARFDEARPLFDRALTIARRLNDPYLQSESLRNVAALLQDEGQLDAALSYYQKAISLARSHGDTMSEARSLNNMGLLFEAQAEYPKALNNLQQSLALRKKLRDRAGEGKVLGNLCIVYSKLNQLELALTYCKTALEIAQDIGDQQREANHLNNIGSLYRRLSKPRDALIYYRRSLKIKRQLSDLAGEARALNHMGEIYWRLGRLESAEKYLEQSLGIKKIIDDLSGQSASHQNLALLYSRQEEYAKAKSHYIKAIYINNRADRPELTWRAYDGLSYVYESLSRPDLAILYGKQALRSIQETRDRLMTLEKDVRQSYLTDKVRVYKHVVDLLISQGRLPEAQQVVSLLKEEEYWHYLDSRGANNGSIGDVVTEIEQDWIEKIVAFDGELGRVGYDIEQLEAKRRKNGLTADENDRLYQLYDTADEVQEAFEAYLLKIESAYQAKVEVGSKQLHYLTSLQDDLERFESRTLIVTFLVLKDNISIIVTSPTIQIPYRILVNEAELNQQVFEFKQRLISAEIDPRPQGRALYDLLISPIMNDLKALETETLLISKDGTLRYLPFAALFDGEQYLAEQFNLVVFTPASRSLLNQTAEEGRPLKLRIAGLGMSDEAEGFQRLPAVEEELDLIVKEDDQNDERGILPGNVRLNRDFTAQSLSEMLGQGYPVVHIASHFYFRPGTIENSFILLGDGSRLSLSDLKSRRYPFRFIDLLTLSACDTAVGGEDAQGREIESFATLAQNRGAQSILATLWPVSDASTGVFMALFYQLRKEQQLTKVQALRKAQKMFISGSQDGIHTVPEHRGVAVAEEDKGLFSPSLQAPFAHPFYWAPYILIGNML